jgi:hypothetical protein
MTIRKLATSGEANSLVEHDLNLKILINLALNPMILTYC